MAQTPAVVIIQGAFQTPEFYTAFESELRSYGFETVHPVLPTCTDIENAEYPKRTITDDARVVHTAIKALVEQGKIVVVLMHSYGGLVGTECIIKELTRDDRKARGLSGGVVHQILLGSVAPAEGSSVKASRGGQWPEDVEVHDDGRYYYKYHDRLFNDFSPEQKAEWSPKTIAHSAAVMTYEIEHAAWRFLPSTAILLDKDEAIPTFVQEMSAKAIGATILHLDAGHESIISATGLTATTVKGVIDSVV